MKLKVGGFFQKIKKKNLTSLARLREKKGEKTQITEIRSEKRDISIDATELTRITTDYQQVYTNKLDNLEEMNKFLETYNLPRLNYNKI